MLVTVLLHQLQSSLLAERLYPPISTWSFLNFTTASAFSSASPDNTSLL
ncbi:MAG: hypothetical protein ACO2PN_04660 [Pyrobaculum sp.]